MKILANQSNRFLSKSTPSILRLAVIASMLMNTTTLFGQDEKANDPVAIFSHKVVANQKCSACHVDSSSVEFDFAFSSEPYAATTVSFFAPKQAKIGNYQVALLDNPILRTQLQLEDKPALVVIDVHGNEEESSLKFGDVIVALRDEPISTLAEFKSKIAKTEKETVTLKGIRGSESTLLEVSIESLSPPKPPFRIGVHVESPSAALRSQLRLFDEEGIVVTEVVKDSPAEKAGLRLHDILLRANGNRLSSQADLRDSVQQSEGEEMELVVMRGGKEESVQVKPKQAAPETTATACPAMPSWNHARYSFDYLLDKEYSPHQQLDSSLKKD